MYTQLIYVYDVENYFKSFSKPLNILTIIYNTRICIIVHDYIYHLKVLKKRYYNHAWRYVIIMWLFIFKALYFFIGIHPLSVFVFYKKKNDIKTWLQNIVRVIRVENNLWICFFCGLWINIMKTFIYTVYSAWIIRGIFNPKTYI